MLKLSPGCSRSTPRRSAARACSIDGPVIEPEVSMMQSTSALVGARRPSAGGMRSQRARTCRCRPSPRSADACVSGTALGTQTSSKSRSAGAVGELKLDAASRAGHAHRYGVMQALHGLQRETGLQVDVDLHALEGRGHTLRRFSRNGGRSPAQRPRVSGRNAQRHVQRSAHPDTESCRDTRSPP